MTKISRFKVKASVEVALTKELWHTLASFKNPKEAEGFFKQFFTPTEISMFAKRLEVLKSLTENNNYQTIRESVEVTDATITRINNLIKLSDKDFSKRVRKLIEEQEERRRKLTEAKKPRKSSLGVTFKKNIASLSYTSV